MCFIASLPRMYANPNVALELHVKTMRQGGEPHARVDDSICVDVVQRGGANVAGHPPPLFLKTASFLFAALFLISLLTRAVRDRAR